MTFDDLSNFIEKKMVMEDGHNYQPVMINTLVSNGGKITKAQIKKALEDKNPEREINKDSVNTVIRVLTLYNPIVKDNGDQTYSLPDFEKYSQEQLEKISNLCDEKIVEASAHSVKNTQNLILFSVSGEAAFSHYTDTMLKDVNTSQFAESKMKQFSKVRTWGSIPTKWSESKWSKLNKGDIILFYRDKNYVGCGILEGTERNSINAKQMWGTKPESNDTWELIMYVLPENVRQANVDYQELNKLLTYKENFMPTRTLDFTLVRNEVIRNMNKKFGTVQNALSSIGFPFDNSSQIEIVKNSKFFLIQVTEMGSTNIIKKGYYEHLGWQETPRDADHGKVKVGDFLVIYFGYKAIDFQKTVKMIYQVEAVSEDNIRFTLKPWRELSGIFRDKIESLVKENKLSKTFDKLSQQGFNISEISNTDVDTILNVDAETSQYWKISPGKNAVNWEKQKQLGIIGIGWNKIGNLSELPLDEIKKKINNIWPGVPNYYPQVHDFLTIKKGDIIVANNGKKQIMGIGRVTGDYQFRPELEFANTYPVDWYDTTTKEIPIQEGWMVTVIQLTKEEFDELVGKKEIPFENNPLLIPDKKDIRTGFDEISKDLLIPKSKIVEIVTALASGRHVLLAGPIGTGKTMLAKKIPEVFWSKIGGYYSEDHTATADWNTQDVIGGIFPKMEGDKPIYEIQNGCVVETVQKNWENGTDGGLRIASKHPQKEIPYRGTWLIIDEFNRADIDKAFGQLFTSLRTKSLKIPTNEHGKSYKELKIPEDYRIIGTLNTADKHFLFQLSDALKSRFAYIEIDIPNQSEKHVEVFYAMQNALKDLQMEDYQDFVKLDENKIIEGDNSSDFIQRVYQAYEILDIVRNFKKLGTAILKLIFQNLIVGRKMEQNTKDSLDNSLTINLIPQLENLPQSEIGAIRSLVTGDITTYFQNAFKSPNRQSFVDAFAKSLKYLEISDKNLLENFQTGNLDVDDEKVWQPLKDSFGRKKQNIQLDLSSFQQALDDLKNSMVI